MMAFRATLLTLSHALAWFCGLGFLNGADQGLFVLALALGLLTLAGRG